MYFFNSYFCYIRCYIVIKGTGNLKDIKRELFVLNDENLYDYLIVEHNEKNVLSCVQKREKRSLNANAYFHVLVNEIARITNISDDECKIKMVFEYGTIAKNEDGTPVTIKIPKHTDIAQFYKYAKWYGEQNDFDFYVLYKPTHTLDRKEMAKLIDGVVSECKELDVPTLDDLKINKMIEEWNIC